MSNRKKIKMSLREKQEARLRLSYQALVDNIEDFEIYDGRGTVDRYVCDRCKKSILTTYKDKGVTPYVIKCDCCEGYMRHTDTYRKEDVPEEKTVMNWYRPSFEETQKLPMPLISHVLRGGLILEGVDDVHEDDNK